MEGMHTFHTDIVYNTLGDRSWIPGKCHRIYIQMHEAKGDQNTSLKIHLEIISKLSIIFTDNGGKI